MPEKKNHDNERGRHPPRPDDGERHRNAKNDKKTDKPIPVTEVTEREILGKRRWLQAPVLPEPQGFSLPLAKGRDAGGDCLARCRPCGRRSALSSASHAAS